MISESTGTLPNASTMASRFAFALTLAVRFVFGLAGMARPPGVPAMAERRAAVRGAVNGGRVFSGLSQGGSGKASLGHIAELRLIFRVDSYI
jgi:hypothetical protein